MAITGLALFLFVAIHLLGNLQIFLGPEAINRYGHFLQSNLEIIWPARIGLLLMVTLHIWSAIKLSAENKAARPISYVNAPVPAAASYASRTMLISGLIMVSDIICDKKLLPTPNVAQKSANNFQIDFFIPHTAKLSIELKK